MHSASPFFPLGSFDDWDELYDYMALYGIHLILGALLSAVTIYRREMSCNRVFHQDDEPSARVPQSPKNCSTTTRTVSDDDDDDFEEETDALLDSAGNFCACQPIIHLANLWMESFPCDDEEGNEPIFPAKLLNRDVTPTDLLEGAGNFWSPEPFLAVMALLMYHHQQQQQQTNNNKMAYVPRDDGNAYYDPFTHHLAPDVHVHIASFLHPKDVVSLSCVSRSYRAVVDESGTSRAIWRTLWERDYAWVVNLWPVGKEALRRSALEGPFHVDKDFYFSFGQVWLNYILAGRNTMTSCMVGLHCHIFDITSFLDAHPGSPDTLMVHSGRDSTRFFEDMGHSLVARRLAKKLCVLVDLSQLSEDGWGLRPTEYTQVGDNNNNRNNNEYDSTLLPPRFPGAGENLLLGRRQQKKSGGGTLKRIRTKLESELAHLESHLKVHFGNDPSVLGNVNPYYDPFRREWRIWYTNEDLETIFGPG